MRVATLLAALSLLGVLLVRERAGAAEDEPAPQGPVPAGTPEAGAAPESAAATPGPAAAWREIQADPHRRSETGARARAYLAEWEALGKEPEPQDLWALGMLLNAAQRGPEAAARFRQAAGLETVPTYQRVASASAYATAVLQAANAGTLAGEPLAAAARDVAGFVDLAKGTTKGSLLATLGHLHQAAGEKERALATWVAAAEADPSRSHDMAANAVAATVDGLHALAEYEAARARLAPVLLRLRALQEQAVSAARRARDEERENSWKARRDQAFRSAERGLETFQDVDLPLRLLGSPAPEWTLVRAYGGGKRLADYRGKVVVLDFWATWCPWCIKSFPALRDLLRAYEGRDVVVVGATTSASTVFDQRYDLDADLKAKDTGIKPKPALTRPRAPATSPDGSEGDPSAQAEHEQALAAFRAKEQDVIAAFRANHEMTWDVVLIDEKEPASKYALKGWPHCVVLDREGRVRHLHSGALLREKPKEIAEFRALIDRLLAEAVPAGR
jgi:thiol-disulfide isomerase/thioredoxin